jgi:hypothetical protein
MSLASCSSADPFGESFNTDLARSSQEAVLVITFSGLPLLPMESPSNPRPAANVAAEEAAFFADSRCCVANLRLHLRSRTSSSAYAMRSGQASERPDQNQH